MKSAASEATKELAVCEKQQVDLEERRKHASTKANKLKKSLKEVSLVPQNDSLITSLAIRIKKPRTRRLVSLRLITRSWRRKRNAFLIDGTSSQNSN